MSLQIPRPIDPSLHPLVTGNYRIATPAIEELYELVTRCLRYRIMGALSKHALEWLRDVHDQLAHHSVRLITFLVGQPQLMEQKAQYQLSGDEQIVARFMIEQMHFRGITGAVEAATCLASYDMTRYPEDTGSTFTAFFYPDAYAAGLRLEQSAAALWNGFVSAHTVAQLAGPVELHNGLLHPCR